AEETALAYPTETQQRKSRDGQYYWQLYIDYQLSAQTLDATASEMRNDSSTDIPHPAFRIPHSQNGHATPTSDGSPGVDLAVTESVPLALFSDQESNANGAEAAPAGVSAGAYNEFEYELIQDPSRLAEVAEMLARESVLGIDTETTGLDPHSVQLLLTQVSTTDKVYIVDCKRLVPLALKPVLEDPRVLKVAQNAKFEYEMLKQQTGITLAGLFDTMLAERVLTSGISREISLKAIAQKYIEATLDKSVRETF